MKPKDEEFCRTKFDSFLKTLPALETIVWEEVAQKDEPPDYYLHLNGSKFAVEVTILMEKISVGTAKLPQLAITASLWSLVDEVEAIAKAENYLRGMYVVSFSRPIDNFGSVKQEVRRNLLDYIRTTQSERSFPKKVVFSQSNQKCTIQKYHSKSDRVAQAGPFNGKWEGEAAIEICNLLEERVSEKSYKLRNIKDPKILLLYDLYHFATPVMYEDCLSKITSLAFFHTIFVADSTHEGFILHSQDQGWAI